MYSTCTLVPVCSLACTVHVWNFTILQEPRPHNFKTAQFFHPTFCTHCGSMIMGLINQGVRCTDCGIACHKKCQSIVPRMCGDHTQEKRGRISLGYYTQRLKEDQWRINIEGIVGWAWSSGCGHVMGPTRTCSYMYM